MTTRPHHGGMQERSVRAVFTDPEAGYIAIYRMRGAGFRVDVSGSVTGDVVVTVQPGPDRMDEWKALVTESDGKVVTDPI